jgi:hypothetical protein
MGVVMIDLRMAVSSSATTRKHAVIAGDYPKKRSTLVEPGRPCRREMPGETRVLGQPRLTVGCLWVA